MKQWIKRILISLAFLAVVAVVGLAIFLLTFDPNAYKYKLEEIVQERYHRDLVIEGDIELSLFPRIGLAVTGVSLSEPGSTETFASIDSARVSVAVWPLLFNRLVVDYVAINGFKARLLRDQQGNFNFENLLDGGMAPMPQARSAGEAAAGATLAGVQAGVDALTGVGSVARRTDMQIDIAGLDLKDGAIDLRDEITGMAMRVSKLNAATGRVTFDQAFDVTVNARVEGSAPQVNAGVTGQGVVKLDPIAMRYAAQKLDLRVEGQMPGVNAKSLTARGNVAFDARSSSLDVSALELLFQGDVQSDTPMTGVEASITVPKLAAHPGRARLQIEKLAVRAKGRLDKSPFELALDAPALDVSPTKAGGEALTGRIRLDGEDAVDASFAMTGLSGNADALDIKEFKVDAGIKQGPRLIKLATTSPLTVSMIRRTAAMSAMKGDVVITDPGLPKGSLQIPVIGSLSADLFRDQASAKINAVLEGGKFDLTTDVTKLAAPRVAFALAVDTLDLDKLAPPVPAAAPAPPKGGSPGSGEQKKAETPAAEAAAAAPADTPLDFSFLQGIVANGTVKVGKLVFRGLNASDVAATLKADKGRLDVSTLAASLYEGKLAGVMYADANGNQAGAKLSLAGIAIEPLLTDVSGKSDLTGRGSVALDLRTAGGTTRSWKHGLDGTMQLRLRDGAIKGINIAQTLRELKATIRGERAEDAGGPRQTDFSELEADIAFAKGVGTVRRLNLAAPVLRVSQGEPATIDLAAGTLDLVANVRVVNTSTGQDGKDLAELKDITIPVHVVGPFEKPDYSIEWSGIGSKALRQTLQNRLLDAISGGGHGKSSGDDARPSADEAAREIGKALKGLLGK